MDPREYQSKSLDLIREEFKKGNKKVLLWLATGGGKTFIFSKMVKETNVRGKKAIVVVRGRKLVDQASQRLFRERVPHGVLMSQHWNYRPHYPVLVCSIDTLISRNLKPEADLIVIDEAHMATSKGYKEFLAHYPDAFVVAVTATPWVPEGLKHIADTVIHPISMQGLIDLGFLVPFRYFAPNEPDLTDVKISSSTKDYVVDQLETAMVAGQLTGKIIDHWISLAEGRPTICFAVNIHHSKLLVDRFNEAGIVAEHCDADTSDDDRNQIIKRLENGTTKVVCNVGIFCTGVDIPSLGAIIMARPTKSRNLFIQQAGRGTRPFEGKTNCILLDHAGNVRRHDFPTDEPEVDLDGQQKPDALKKETKICKNCFAAFRGRVCPECGVEPPEHSKVVVESDEKLSEVKPETNPIKIELRRLMREKKHRKIGWVYHKLVEKFSLEMVKEYLPDWFIRNYETRNSDLFGRSPFTPITRG